MARFNPDDYVDVQERIVRFWSEFPDGSIVTKLMSPPDDFTQCRYEAQVWHRRDDPRPAATGYAFELAGGNAANATSHEENCETSAIGRALANMGYAKTRADRPGRQEMAKVERATGTDGARPVGGPTPVPRQNVAPRMGPPPSGRISWDDFWKWARSKKFEDRASINAVIPDAVTVDDPTELKRAVEAFLGEVKQG